jgi:hypothetical protein
MLVLLENKNAIVYGAAAVLPIIDAAADHRLRLPRQDPGQPSS